jgi:tetratricopeptide (TPR) repeat protein
MPPGKKVLRCWRLAAIGSFGCFLLLLSSCQSTEGILSNAKTLQAEKKFEEAELQFRRVLQKDPNSAEAMLGLADCLREQGSGQEALASYLRAYELSGQNREIQKTVGRVLVNTFLVNRAKPKAIYDELTRISKALLTTDPESVEGLQIRGTLAMEDRSYDRAVRDLQTAYRLNPNDSILSLTLVEALSFNEQYKEAEALALELLKANPKNTPVYSRLYWIYLETNRLADARALLERHVQAAPGNSLPVLRLARHIAQYDKNPARAKQIIDDMVRNTSGYPQGALEAGKAYLASQRYAEAIEALEFGLERSPNKVEHRKMLAEAHMQLGNPQAAAAQLNQARKEAPEDQSLIMAEAVIYLLESTPASAERSLQMLEELKAKGYSDRQLDFQRARAMMQSNRGEEGARILQELLRTQKRNVEVRFALAGYYMGRGRLNDALRLIEEVETMSPDNENALLARLGLLRQLGRLDEARNLVQQAKKRYPDNFRFSLEDAILALDQKRFDLALNNYQKLYNEGVRSVPVVSGIVQAHLGNGKPALAMAFIEKELKSDPGNPAYRAIRADLMAQANNLKGAISEYELLAAAAASGPVTKRRLAGLYVRAGEDAKANQMYLKLAEATPLTPVDQALWLSSALSLRDAATVKRVCQLLEPNFAKDWASANNCAYAMADLGSDLKRAEELVMMHLKDGKGPANLKDTLSYVRIRQGRHSEALQILDPLVQTYANSASFRFHRGLALQGSGRTQEAMAEYALAAKNNADPRLRKRIEAAQSGASTR